MFLFVHIHLLTQNQRKRKGQLKNNCQKLVKITPLVKAPEIESQEVPGWTGKLDNHLEMCVCQLETQPNNGPINL